MATAAKERFSLDLWVTEDQKKAILDFFKAMKIKAKSKTEEPEPTKEEILEGIRQAVGEVKLAKEGKLQLPSLSTPEEIRRYFDAL